MTMDKVGAKNQIRRNILLSTLLERGETSLVNLARATGMSLPMVTNIVASLKKEKFIHKCRGKETDRVGRPPFVVKLNGEAGFVLGIDIGHLNTNMVLLNLEQNIVAEFHRQSFPLSNDPSVIDLLSGEIDAIVKKTGIDAGKLLGIGISIPGMVRSRQGVSETYLHFGDKSLRALLQERWKKSVVIAHDAKAMALGEKWFGAAKNFNNVLCLNIGWGLGLGIILDGKIYYGRDGFAGEFGHIQIVPDGLLCICGKRGCLETVASGRAIAQNAMDRLANGAKSKLISSMKKEPANIDAAQVVKAAVAGDQFSIEILEEAGRYLGEGVAKLINIFNPELIILGGGVARAQHFILDPVRSTALKQSLVLLNQNVRFTVSELGAKSGALGVARMAARDLFEVEHLNPSAFV
jgi:glucokinase-like ROK family protein